MKNIRRISVVALLTALYFVLAVLIKIPLVGHIYLDMGYIALMVGAVYLGAVPAAIIGAIGALLESAMIGSHGVSIGWILMNAIVGFSSGFVLQKLADGEKKKLVIAAVIVVSLSMLVGVAVKTLLECAMYHYALAVKIPSGITAWVADSAVMLVIGLPLCLVLKGRVKKLWK